MRKNVQYIVILLAVTATLIQCRPEDKVQKQRSFDPVVLSGKDLPELIGEEVGSIVGFIFDATTTPSWIQIPIQVDERHVQNWEIIKDGDCRILGRNATDLMYADPNTLSGPDEDPTFDEDDELVFMARHLGQQRYNGGVYPYGVKPNSIVELVILEPLLLDDILGYAYLFVVEMLPDGTNVWFQNAGQQLVNYQFNLTTQDPETGSNDYLDVYKFACEDPADIHVCNDKVMNPEDTWFKSQHYERHYKENWYSDELRITTTGANGQNFWGMEDFQFYLRDCSRCTKSFMQGPTGFVANINGPVRSIRSWAGANSGALTQREAIMYEQREDQTTFMRVHTIPGTFDYVNFKAGMPLRYYNCHNLNGLSVDGSMSKAEQEFDQRFCPWEMVTGDTGTFLRTIDVVHDLGDWFGADNVSPNEFMRSWYYDNASPVGTDPESGAPEHPNKWFMCSTTVDNQTEAWGTMGFKLKDFLYLVPNTDPTRNHLWQNLPPEACDIETAEPWLYHVTVLTRNYFLQPGISTSTADHLYQGSVAPLFRQV